VARLRRHVSVLLVLFSVAVFVGVDMSAQTSTADVAERAPSAAWPCRLHVAADLRAFANLAWEHSPTFRDQCRKLAAGRAYVIVEASSETWRAETHIRVTRDGVTFARARVRPTKDAVELIAHELEHVLESLDGVRFLMEAGYGRSRVSLTAGAYETERAIEAGRRVAQEVCDSLNARRRLNPLPENR
jgi:hypothetical protein